MRIIYICLFIALFISACKPAQNSTKVHTKELWKSSKELKIPESVMYDKQRDVLYVANINGKPIEKNGKGFISKFSPAGTLLKLQWITNLHAPKGMGIVENTLYVTDIDEVVAIDIQNDKIKQRFKAKNAQFLNDIAIASNSVVYISDMTAHRIYALANNSVSVFLQFAQALSPNGLDINGERLYVGTNRGIIECNINTKAYGFIIPLNYGIDGLKQVGDMKFLTSDWLGRVRLEQKGSSLLLLDTTSQSMQAADFEFIPAKQLLIVPTFYDNRIIAYQVTPGLK